MGASCSTVSEAQSRVRFLYSGVTMVIRRVYDLFAQCLLGRWEEEYNTMETLPLEGWERLPYIRFLCAGQEVRLRVHATANVTVAISDARAYHDGTFPCVRKLL